MTTEPELLNERLERLAIVLDGIMPNCALLVRDALELLTEQNNVIEKAISMLDIIKDKINELQKEQEAVKPKSKVRHGANAQIQHFCGNCNSMLHGKPKFCSECGRSVKWE